MRRKAFSWVPNLFTLANLSLGFFAIVIASQGQSKPGLFTLAGFFILISVFFDGLDGWAARLLDARSEIGAQLDSLADLTTFGIAPGVLMYHLALNEFNLVIASWSIPTGLLLAAAFPCFAAYRLARFNVSHDPDSFVGLPSPVAGLVVALLPIVMQETIKLPLPVLAGLFFFVGYLMVSTVKYSKPQVTFIRRFSPIRLGIAVVVVVLALLFAWIRYGHNVAALGLFTLIIIYVASGIVSLIIHFIQEYRV